MNTFGLLLLAGSVCGIIMVLGGILLLYKGAISLNNVSGEEALTIWMGKPEMRKLTVKARANNLPAPGLTVPLWHPALGRSAPAVTDAYGRFLFYGTPIMPAPYYIEVYWGYQLIYRATVPVHTVTVTLPPLFL
jgi:hypothetical protein